MPARNSAIRTSIATGALALLLPILGSQSAAAQSVYFGHFQKACNNGAFGVTSCRVDLPAVTAGRTLTTARATCTLRASPNVRIKHVQAGHSGPAANGPGLQNGPFLAPILKTSDELNGGNSWHALNSEMLFTVPAGNKPFVTVTFNNSPTMVLLICNVAGTLAP